ncbi:putative phosphinothricin acetyltransferase YwnH [Lentilactobacillus parabuchneri]|nr:GNAT family N-acetyltransferase [Lentilactobacillus parabuchneri]APR07803.1 Putative phosphinothricin acetyltransferase YwnH [Lentilactobacillus parabuchneri]MBW0222227.1 GNAT family N-acetyltransferase [Lentilactobacillus parabuchneri]MBW0245536.1 GNAT family N-acetyltransferase [Lentilactobacillus parabuchneri]MBW0263604.1 GNAT family N-acetyltransferase [Lentilactobacillus parabuchneri]MCT2884189.1 N-acetyltransferase [Lentilactobacillus parabuchneri]
MSIRYEMATQAQLPRIVEIYNQIIPSRLATADLEPVSVASRQAWFNAFNPDTRPLWVMKDGTQIAGWVGLESFYGRPAYHKTAEISIYIDENFRHRGLGQQTIDFVTKQLPDLGLDGLVAFIFSHNTPSQKLFKHNGFEVWGHLPDVAEMDGKRRSLDILGKHF